MGESAQYFNTPAALRLGGEMADTRDLKSLARKGVRVRLPPQAPATIGA